MHEESIMNKKLILLCVVLVIAAFALAQGKPGGGQPNPQPAQPPQGGQQVQPNQAQGNRQALIADLARELKQFTLTQDEADKIIAVLEKDANALELARAEIKEMQAKLARLLLEEKTNKAEIEKTVRQSIEVEYRLRIMQIERSLAVRELLGRNRWAILIRIQRQLNEQLTKDDIQALVKLGVDAETLKLLFRIAKALQ